MHAANDIHISKATHATWIFAAQNSRANGASAASVKSMGGWADGSAFGECYDRQLPKEALLGSAMFNSNKPETYFLARDVLSEFQSLLLFYFLFICSLSIDPSAALTALIFPWVESEQAALNSRQLLEDTEERSYKDRTLQLFLQLLIWL